MTNDNKAKIYRGNGYRVNDKIVLQHHTLGEISDFGISEYFRGVQNFCEIPLYLAYQLSLIEIDFREISNIELFFIMLCGSTQKLLKFIFGTNEFQDIKLYKSREDNSKFISNGIVIITEKDYNNIVDGLRIINQIPSPEYTSVNDSQINIWIEKQKSEIEHIMKEKQYGLYKEPDILLPLVSAMTNYSGFKYDYDTVWNVKLYTFLDGVNRSKIIKNSDHLYTGLYSGCIEFKNIKNELDWQRQIC